MSLECTMHLKIYSVYLKVKVDLEDQDVNKKNSMVWVRERTISTERTQLVGEVSANILWIEGATWSAWWIPTALFSVF
jgi:hypothetical protein